MRPPVSPSLRPFFRLGQELNSFLLYDRGVAPINILNRSV